MATKNDGERIKCTFQWKIENVSHGWRLKKGERITSPMFIVDGLEDTKWSLWLYLKGSMEENDIVVHLHREIDCSGPDFVEVEYHLAFLGIDGSVLEEDTIVEGFEIGDDSISLFLDAQERVFVTDRETFLPEDTLTVQCKIRKTEKEGGKEGLVKSMYLYARSVLKVIRKSFDWRIDKFSTLQPGIIKKFKGNLIEFDLILNEDSGIKLRKNIISFHDCIKYISCNTSIIDSEGKRESCGINRYFIGDDFMKGMLLSSMLIFPTNFIENKNRYLPNDVLSLDFDIVISTVEHFDCRKYSAKGARQEKYENMAVLIEDLKSMYCDRIFSDTELRTLTQTFPAHKNILSARSAVFRNMCSHDMKNIGHIAIDDLEDDTVRRMLLFIYTGLLEDLQFVSASKLYTAADKYEILSLKRICSSFLKDNLCPTTVCDVLLLADLHQDDDLKNAVHVYILEHDEVFRSLEWKHFMDTNIKLAADIMYRKVNHDEI